jgi:hypothetical protein
MTATVDQVSMKQVNCVKFVPIHVLSVIQLPFAQLVILMQIELIKHLNVYARMGILMMMLAVLNVTIIVLLVLIHHPNVLFVPGLID